MCKMYEIIETLCDNHGIKPGRMCADLGISRGIMGDLKAGRTKKLSAANMEKIASYFGVSTDYLLGNESGIPNIYLTDSQQKILFEAFTSACDELRITQGEAIVHSNISYNFFPRLKNTTLHTANEQDLLAVADYLGIKDDVSRIITNKPEFDSFTYAMHEESKDLSEDSKQILLNLARELRRCAINKRDGKTK